jgi:hypothetical protein
MSLYGGLFYNDIGTAYVSADVPHLYRAWTGVGTWVYQGHAFNGFPKYVGIYSGSYTVYKWVTFLPYIAGVGAPLLVSMRVPSSGVHAIDSIEPTNGGWNVFGTSAPKTIISQSATTPWYSYSGRYLRQNECGYVWVGNMIPSGPSDVLGYDINPVDAPMLPVIDAYAGYTPNMRDGSTTGISIANTAGVEVFGYPAKFKPIKGRADVLVAAPVSFSTNRTQALVSGTSGKSIVFYGSGQYLFDRAFYYKSITMDYGCDGYGGYIASYRTLGLTIVLRNMIAADGYVYPTPVSNSAYNAFSYVDNSHSTDSWGGPISNVSGSTSSGYQISTTSINQTSEYAVAIPI